MVKYRNSGKATYASNGFGVPLYIEEGQIMEGDDWKIYPFMQLVPEVQEVKAPVIGEVREVKAPVLGEVKNESSDEAVIDEDAVAKIASSFKAKKK